jgi:hypothetical protein
VNFYLHTLDVIDPKDEARSSLKSVCQPASFRAGFIFIFIFIFAFAKR